MEKAPKEKLKSIFADILKGYSYYNNIYIKHFSNVDNADLDIKHNLFLEKAKNDGLPSELERLESIKKDCLWTDSKERELMGLKTYISTLNSTLKQFFKQVDIQPVKELIKETAGKILEMEVEKEGLIGFTAEKYASSKINQYYIFKALFKDQELKEPYLSSEEFEETDDSELEKLALSYNQALLYHNPINMQRIAISPFFINMFALCDNNPLIFWGNPLIKLTLFQIELFSYGIQFKNILRDLKVPPTEDLLDNPDKLVEHHTMVKNSQELLNKNANNEGFTAIVGATSEEMKSLGMVDSNNTIDFAKEAKKRGKNKLTMDDLTKV